MFEKILVPLDGSFNAEGALPWADRYSHGSLTRVVLVRVVDTLFLPHHEAARLHEEAEKYLATVQRYLDPRTSVKTVVLDGLEPAREIIDTVINEGCGLTIMARRGGSAIARLLMGGITELVMRLSPVPVLVTESRTVLDLPGCVRKILVPVDGSALAEAVVPSAEQLARFHGARLEFLHVVPEARGRIREACESVRRNLKERMDEYCHTLGTRNLEATFEAVPGDAAAEILKAAKGADMIAMTTHGYSGVKRWVLGSVAEKVMHEAPVPVFVQKGAATPGVRRQEEAALKSR